MVEKSDNFLKNNNLQWWANLGFLYSTHCSEKPGIKLDGPNKIDIT